MTKIEWAHETWNPVTGCSPISAGCDNCYARRMAQRLKGRFGYPKDDPFKVTFHPDRLDQPFKWKKPRRIFVCSMGDIFHENVKHGWVDKILLKTQQYPQHVYMFLTKRPKNMGFWCFDDKPNIWIGVTAEDQRSADERIPVLLQIPAVVRFVSVEPMLGYVDPWLPEKRKGFVSYYPGKGIDWVICGAETGPGARPMRLGWARDLRDQCQEAGVPFFFKSAGNKSLGFIPYDLMVREFPGDVINGSNVLNC